MDISWRVYKIVGKRTQGDNMSQVRTIHISLPKLLFEVIIERATKERRSISQQIAYELEQGLITFSILGKGKIESSEMKKLKELDRLRRIRETK